MAGWGRGSWAQLLEGSGLQPICKVMSNLVYPHVFSFVFTMGRGHVISVALFGQCTENILYVMKFNAYTMLAVASYFIFIYLFCFGFLRQGHTL